MCALCDHRDNVMCHFAIFLLLILNASGRYYDYKDDEKIAKGKKQASIFSPLRFVAGNFSVLTALVSIFYFGSWSLYRTSQQNMSFYALFGTHLFGVIFMLFDHEMMEDDK